MVKRELSQKAFLSIYRSIYVPSLTYSHELWVMTERMRLQVPVAKMSYNENIAAAPLHGDKRVASWTSPGEVFQACPSRRKPWDSPRTHWRDYISWLAWEDLSIPLEELVEVTGERKVWISLFPPQPGPE